MSLKRLPNLVLFTVSVLFVFSLISCSPGLDSYSSLVNKGKLPLSPSNAYLGSNAFLAGEFSKSPMLYNFLRSRGAPSAIEVSDGKFSTKAPQMILYYPKDKEIYIAELHRTREEYNWITRGPFAINRNDYRELSRAGGSNIYGEALFVSGGREFRFKELKAMGDEQQTVVTLQIPKPTPVPTRIRPKVIKSAPNTSPAEATAVVTPLVSGNPDDPKSFQSMNFDQQALLISQGYAERGTNGDVIHTVRSEKETLREIVKWYTGDSAILTEVANLNLIQPEGQLLVGRRIRIPFASIKQTKQMPIPH